MHQKVKKVVTRQIWGEAYILPGDTTFQMINIRVGICFYNILEVGNPFWTISPCVEKSGYAIVWKMHFYHIAWLSSGGYAYRWPKGPLFISIFLIQKVSHELVEFDILDIWHYTQSICALWNLLGISRIPSFQSSISNQSFWRVLYIEVRYE